MEVFAWVEKSELKFTHEYSKKMLVIWQLVLMLPPKLGF